VTDIPPKPKRRRWGWLAIVAGVSFTLSADVFWLRHVETSTHRCLAYASQQALMMNYETVCIIPGLTDNEVGERFMGKRVVTLVTFDAEDAEDILALPPCLVERKIRTFNGTPQKAIARLRVRFESAVQ
jgi:hypothetical protein